MRRRILPMILACCMLPAPMHASAAEEKLHMAVDHIIIKQEELPESRTLPLYVRLRSPHAPVTSVEFGIEVDTRCSYEIITANRAARDAGGEGLDVTCVTASNDWFTWAIWAVAEPDAISENYLLVNVTLPEDAGYGDCYPVCYRDSSDTTRHKWYCISGGETVNYVLDDAIEWEDGYVLIAPDKGDVNVDGAVDILDVIALNKFLLGSRTLETAARYAAETDGTEGLDAGDSLQILKYVVELLDTLEG